MFCTTALSVMFCLFVCLRTLLLPKLPHVKAGLSHALDQAISQLPFSTDWWTHGDDAFIAATTSQDTFVLFGAPWDGHCKYFISSVWTRLPSLVHANHSSRQFILYGCVAGGHTQQRLCTELLRERMQYYTLVLFAPPSAPNTTMRIWSYEGIRDSASVAAFLSSDVRSASKRWSNDEERQATKWLYNARQQSSARVTDWWAGSHKEFVSAINHHPTCVHFGNRGFDGSASVAQNKWPQLSPLMRSVHPTLQFLSYDCGHGSKPLQLCVDVFGHRGWRYRSDVLMFDISGPTRARAARFVGPMHGHQFIQSVYIQRRSRARRRL